MAKNRYDRQLKLEYHDARLKISIFLVQVQYNTEVLYLLLRVASYTVLCRTYGVEGVPLHFKVDPTDNVLKHKN